MIELWTPNRKTVEPVRICRKCGGVVLSGVDRVRDARRYWRHGACACCATCPFDPLPDSVDVTFTGLADSLLSDCTGWVITNFDVTLQCAKTTALSGFDGVYNAPFFTSTSAIARYRLELEEWPIPGMSMDGRGWSMSSDNAGDGIAPCDGGIHQNKTPFIDYPDDNLSGVIVEVQIDRATCTIEHVYFRAIPEFNDMAALDAIAFEAYGLTTQAGIAIPNQLVGVSQDSDDWPSLRTLVPITASGTATITVP